MHASILFPPLRLILCRVMVVAALCPAFAAATDKRVTPPESTPVLRIAIAGLEHGHINSLMRRLQSRTDVQLVGVAEANSALVDAFCRRYAVDRALLHGDLAQMLDALHPHAVLVLTPTAKHLAVIEQCASRGIHVMVEKPLSTTLDDALAIRRIAQRAKIHVLVNYEPTWYANYNEAQRIVSAGELGRVRRTVVNTGHRGPREIGVSDAFLAWLRDPQLNGDGALFDFACYGSIFSTWIMEGRPPLRVTAVVSRYKPDVYPQVSDDSTLILDYGDAQTVIQASWNWPFDRKDVEIYGETGFVLTDKRDVLRIRRRGDTAETVSTPLPARPGEDDPLAHLKSVVLEGKPANFCSSLDANVTVMQILDAAVRAAADGRTVRVAEHNGP
jgi:predicted dehydrogenase